MAAHEYTLTGTKALRQAREEKRQHERMVRLAGHLDQEALERSLADAPDEWMRAKMLEHWKPHLTFEPHPDTMARAYELRLATLIEKGVVECRECTRVAGITIKHLLGQCAPGAVLARAAVENAGADHLVLLPPGVTLGEPPAETVGYSSRHHFLEELRPKDEPNG